MKAVTASEYERMGWHDRQRLVIRLNTEKDAMIGQLNRAAAVADEMNTDGRSRVARPLTTQSQLLAKALLELLPPDPDGPQHCADLIRELNNHRKAKQP